MDDFSDKSSDDDSMNSIEATAKYMYLEDI